MFVEIKGIRIDFDKVSGYKINDNFGKGYEVYFSGADISIPISKSKKETDLFIKFLDKKFESKIDFYKEFVDETIQNDPSTLVSLKHNFDDDLTAKYRGLIILEEDFDLSGYEDDVTQYDKTHTSYGYGSYYNSSGSSGFAGGNGWSGRTYSVGSSGNSSTLIVSDYLNKLNNFGLVCINPFDSS